MRKLSLPDRAFGKLISYILDENVTDINWSRGLWINDLEKGRYKVENFVLDDLFIQQFYTKISNMMNVSFNQNNPLLEAETDNLRISILHDSVTNTGISISIRKTPAIRRINRDKILQDAYCTESIDIFMENAIRSHCTVVVGGLPGVGKTELSLRLAEWIGSPILSADSRQLYKDLPIGTAAPTAEQQKRVVHYFVGTLSLTDYYSASQFEQEVLASCEKLFSTHDSILMTGGSMMYIDAVTKGIDDIPTVRPEIRDAVWQEYEEKGLAPFVEELKKVDPLHFEEVDINNYKRVIHAIEICRQTGLPYSSFRTKKQKDRPFKIIQVGLTRDREELYDRINRRVDQMVADGLVEEAKRVYPFRQYNSLNTVGYKELFTYFDGEWSLDTAIEKIKRNSRVYARKQMTWFKRDKGIMWFHPEQEEEIKQYILSQRD